MPNNCDMCFFSAWSNFYQIYVCNAVREKEPVLFDGEQTKSTAVVRSARADNCPLIPADDVRPVIKATWNTVKYPLYECSNCGAVYQDVGYEFNFCPNCQADMRRKTDEYLN